jgi:hypothetical protein
MVQVDKPVSSGSADSKIPATDGKMIPLKAASHYMKSAHISKTFGVPVIAVLPPASTTNEMYLSSSLLDTLQHLSDEGEPLFFKMRSGIRLVCTASFLGDKGVTTAIPLAITRALEKAPKDGPASLLECAGIIAPLSDAQLADNVG